MSEAVAPVSIMARWEMRGGRWSRVNERVINEDESEAGERKDEVESETERGLGGDVPIART
jgi:hypothetical protein